MCFLLAVVQHCDVRVTAAGADRQLHRQHRARPQPKHSQRSRNRGWRHRLAVLAPPNLSHPLPH